MNMESVDFPSFEIKIKCQASESLKLEQLKNFQGNLKKRTATQVEQIMQSIIKYGFSFPFFIWKRGKENLCLDGHGRILALKEFKKRGTKLPAFPVSYIEAENEEEAKQKLLRHNSSYGSIDIEELLDFTEDLQIEELLFPELDLLDIKEGDEEEYSKKEITVKPSSKALEKIHILISVDPDKFFDIQSNLKELKNDPEVEYVQSGN